MLIWFVTLVFYFTGIKSKISNNCSSNVWQFAHSSHLLQSIMLARLWEIWIFREISSDRHQWGNRRIWHGLTSYKLYRKLIGRYGKHVIIISILIRWIDQINRTAFITFAVNANRIYLKKKVKLNASCSLYIAYTHIECMLHIFDCHLQPKRFLNYTQNLYFALKLYTAQ